MSMFYVSSPHLCALAGIAAVSALLFKLVIYPTIFSPLSKIPAAHPLASVTSLWIQWQRFRDREFQCISAAFTRKGPYVRLGPNEIAINSMEGVLSVYGVGSNNFDKHQSYEYFITHGSVISPCVLVVCASPSPDNLLGEPSMQESQYVFIPR